MTTEKKKAYLKEYYKKNKEKYAYSKRLQYWRNKARNLGELEIDIINATIEQLKIMCAEHLN